jgi:site-specific recombinase XerD
MTSEALTVSRTESQQGIVQAVLDSVQSEHTKRAYRRALGDFLGWYAETGQASFDKAVVNHYKEHLVQDRGLGASSVNQRLSAIRTLAREAADHGALSDVAAHGIARARGVRQDGVRAGNWLTRDQAQALLDAPGTTMKGLRDRALLAVLLGAGLRRTEAAALTFDRIQQRDGRWVIVDMRGKRGRIRSVPIAAWVKLAIDAWASAANVHAGRVFRSVNKAGRVDGDRISSQAVYNVIREYAALLGFERLAAHDTRRSFAKLAHMAGAPIEQIQLSLGHGSLQTTERYLGITQSMTDAPSDYLDLTV